MSFVTFMGSHWPTLALSVAAAALSAFVLLVSGASAGLSLLVAGVVVGAGLLSIAIDYRRKRPLSVAAAALSAFVLLVSGASAGLSLLVAGVVVGAGLLSIAIDYRRKRPFYGDLAACTDDLEHPLWIFEMVDEPDYPEGRLAYEALSAVSKAANDDVSEYRRQAQDYREYVETWVHEAKSPLAAAHLMLENLMESLPADETGEVLLEKTEALGEELDRVEGFIEQALFFARSESLDRDYLIRPYSLQKLVGDAVRANARVLMGAHVAPYRIDLEQTVFTDEKWMNFILGQLARRGARPRRGVHRAGAVLRPVRVARPRLPDPPQ